MDTNLVWSLPSMENSLVLLLRHMNLMHTDSTIVHWHGIHQRESPEWDGIAFISQTPILPGQTFRAKPHGTSFYHAHCGDQRSMGLYGGFVVHPSYKLFPQSQYGFTVVLQDWNHDDEPETLYQRMLNGVYETN